MQVEKQIKFIRRFSTIVGWINLDSPSRAVMRVNSFGVEIEIYSRDWSQKPIIQYQVSYRDDEYKWKNMSNRMDRALNAIKNSKEATKWKR